MVIEVVARVLQGKSCRWYGGCQIVIRVVVARVIKVDARVVMVVAMVI